MARRAARQVPVGDGRDDADGLDDATADGRVELEERDALLRRAFAGLTLRCRELLGSLLADDNPSYAEVSQILEMPVGSIGPTRARCLACLRVVSAAGVTADWR